LAARQRWPYYAPNLSTLLINSFYNNEHLSATRHLRLGEEETLRLIKEYYEAAKKTTPPFVAGDRQEEREAVAYAAPENITLNPEYEQWSTCTKIWTIRCSSKT
jgi:hypothetical protein